MQVIEEESENGDELINSNGDLLSNPRHSELSLISGSSGLLQQSQNGGTRPSKEVRDPNFTNQSIGKSLNAQKDYQNRNHQDIFNSAVQYQQHTVYGNY